MKNNNNLVEESLNILRNTPTLGLINTVNLVVNILSERGVNISDFDKRNKIVKQIQMIGKNCYFLCENDEKQMKDELEKYNFQKENNIFLLAKINNLMKENNELKKQLDKQSNNV